MKKDNNKEKYNIAKLIWYIIIEISFTILVIIFWNKCVKFEPFNGYSLLFSFWIGLTVLPLINKIIFANFGVETDFLKGQDKNDEDTSKLKNEFHQEVYIITNERKTQEKTNDVDILEKKAEKIIKSKKEAK